MLVHVSHGAPRRMAKAVGDRTDLAALPARICAASVEVLPVDGAAISVVTAAGHRATVASVGVTAARGEELQLVMGEGPCVEAHAGGATVLVRDLGEHLSTTHRWPAFARAAEAAGVCGVYAFPLRVGTVGLGTFGLYRGQRLTLDEDEMTEALWGADAAATALLDLGSAEVAGEQTEKPEPAFHRSEVYQAVGMIMVQLEVDGERAMLRLRAHAFANDLALEAAAHEVVERRLRFERDDR